MIEVFPHLPYEITVFYLGRFLYNTSNHSKNIATPENATHGSRNSVIVISSLKKSLDCKCKVFSRCLCMNTHSSLCFKVALDSFKKRTLPGSSPPNNNMKIICLNKCTKVGCFNKRLCQQTISFCTRISKNVAYIWAHCLSLSES